MKVVQKNLRKELNLLLDLPYDEGFGRSTGQFKGDIERQ